MLLMVFSCCGSAAVWAQLLKKGPFTLSTVSEAEMQFDTNVYQTETNAQFDRILHTYQNATVSYERPRSTTTVSGTVDSFHNVRFTQNSFVDADANAEHLILISPLWVMKIAGSVARSHQLPGAPDTDIPDTAAEPIELFTSSAAVVVERETKRGKIELSAAAERLDYRDVKTLGGGKADQDFRDAEGVSARASYEHNFSSRLSAYAFFNASTTDVRGPENRPDVFSRDATRYETGLSVNLTAFPKLDFGFQVGTLEEFFHDDRVAHQGILMRYQASMNWSPFNPVSFSAVWRHRESGVNFAEGGGSGITEAIGLSMVLTPTRRFKFSLSGKHSNTEFPGGREIVNRGVTASLEYEVNRHTALIFGYGYSSRDSTVLNDSYDKEVFQISARASF